jgi:hypothetical protein
MPRNCESIKYCMNCAKSIVMQIWHSHKYVQYYCLPGIDDPSAMRKPSIEGAQVWQIGENEHDYLRN